LFSYFVPAVDAISYLRNLDSLHAVHEVKERLPLIQEVSRQQLERMLVFTKDIPTRPSGLPLGSMVQFLYPRMADILKSQDQLGFRCPAKENAIPIFRTKNSESPAECDRLWQEYQQRPPPVAVKYADWRTAKIAALESVGASEVKYTRKSLQEEIMQKPAYWLDIINDAAFCHRYLFPEIPRNTGDDYRRSGGIGEFVAVGSVGTARQWLLAVLDTAPKQTAALLASRQPANTYAFPYLECWATAEVERFCAAIAKRDQALVAVPPTQKDDLGVIHQFAKQLVAAETRRVEDVRRKTLLVTNAIALPPGPIFISGHPNDDGFKDNRRLHDPFVYRNGRFWFYWDGEILGLDPKTHSMERVGSPVDYDQLYRSLRHVKIVGQNHAEGVFGWVARQLEVTDNYVLFAHTVETDITNRHTLFFSSHKQHGWRSVELPAIIERMTEAGGKFYAEIWLASPLPNRPGQTATVCIDPQTLRCETTTSSPTGTTNVWLRTNSQKDTWRAASRQYGFEVINPIDRKQDGTVIIVRRAGNTNSEEIPIRFEDKEQRGVWEYAALTPESILVPFTWFARKRRGFWEIPYADIQKWLAANPPAADKPVPKAGGSAPATTNAGASVTAPAK
jgi:hypothetical protein